LGGANDQLIFASPLRVGRFCSTSTSAVRFVLELKLIAKSKDLPSREGPDDVTDGISANQNAVFHLGTGYFLEVFPRAVG
jgi:hypothetical protein